MGRKSRRGKSSSRRRRKSRRGKSSSSSSSSSSRQTCSKGNGDNNCHEKTSACLRKGLQKSAEYSPGSQKGTLERTQGQRQLKDGKGDETDNLVYLLFLLQIGRAR